MQRQRQFGDEDGDIPESPGILRATLRNLLVVVVVTGGLVAILAATGGTLLQDIAAQKKADKVLLATPGAGGQSVDNDHGGGEALKANRSGHFLADIEVGSARIKFLVDSGATKVVLTREDARRAGVSLHNLSFTQKVATANGTIETAAVTLRRMRLGSITLYDVEALVSRAPMQVSLLGMSFLSRLSAWEVRGDQLFLSR